MAYWFWRGKTLWCRFPLPGKKPSYSLGIKLLKDTETERRKCERLAEFKISEFRVASVTGELQAKRKVEYNPKFWRLVARYWYFHLRFQKSAKCDKFHLMHCLRKFGKRFANEITREEIEVWRQDMLKAGSSVNAINARFAYMVRVFNYALEESDSRTRLTRSPCLGMKKLAGGKIRSFLLTPEKFERNYLLLRDGRKWPGEKPNKHCNQWQVPPDPRFAFFYLVCWETGRRPQEVAQYTWEMVNTVEVDGRNVSFISVPPEIAKTAVFDNVIISDRLMHEMKQLAYRQGLIARNSNGGQWKYWVKQKRQLVKVFGDDAGWIRDTRRGFVTRKVVEEGHNETDVMKQSGHRTRATLERYRISQLRDQAKIMLNFSAPNQSQNHA